MELKKEPTKSKLDEIPKTTPQKIIIESKGESYTFDKKTYIPRFLDHCISKFDYDAIIEGASRIMGQSWTKKRQNDQIKLPKHTIFLAIAALVFTLIYMILLYSSVTSENGITMLIIAVICVFLGSFIAFGLSIYNFTREIGRFKSLEEIIDQDLDEYFAYINKNYIDQLQFLYNSKGRFIECNIKRVYIPSKDEILNEIPDQVDEEPEENEEDLDKKFRSVKHSRAQSAFSGPKKVGTVKLSKMNKVSHNRAQSSAMRREDESDLFGLKNDLQNLRSKDY
jgi:hypothetical protein